MTLETDLRNMRPALDRAIAGAATVERRPAAPRTIGAGSRRRAAVFAFAVAVCVAAFVGIVVRLDSSSRHGDGVPPLDTSGVTHPTASTTNEPTTTTSTEPLSTTSPQSAVPLSSVDWGSVSYPIAPRCGDVFHPPVTVGHVGYAAPAGGVHLAIVEVACTHGAGTPPVAVYVYDGASSTSTPHLAATLVAASDGWQANALRVDGSAVSLPVYGFSSASIPNCCPDVRTTLVWHWSGSRYELVSAVPPHVTRPAYGGY
jgi:hypothetical protein